MAVPVSAIHNSSSATIDPSPVLHRSIHSSIPKATHAKGSYIFLENGRKILDATGGAAVCCVGHADDRVVNAIAEQAGKVSYLSSIMFTTDSVEEAGKVILEGCGEAGKGGKVWFASSGSEATEAALKLARQYHLEKSPPEPQRSKFISRRESYHGITLGSLSVSGHITRKENFLPLLKTEVGFVSPCNEYRGRRDEEEWETREEYVRRLAEEMDAEFRRLGPDTVIAFVAETVVGAALGCVPPVEGYFKAMREVCDRYGALLIIDEVMCGMGRTGKMHAWMDEGIVPDLQMVGKGLGGGYVPAAGVIVYEKVVNVLGSGSGAFAHGQTYQAHPLSCAATLAVQKIYKEDNLLPLVLSRGSLLSSLLHSSLSAHPNVGNIRGRGLFWGIEFVKDKKTKEPFDPGMFVCVKVHEKAMEGGVSIYPGNGCAGNGKGDQVLICPPFNVTEEEVRFAVGVLTRAVEEVFAELKEQEK